MLFLRLRSQRQSFSFILSRSNKPWYLSSHRQVIGSNTLSFPVPIFQFSDISVLRYIRSPESQFSDISVLRYIRSPVYPPLRCSGFPVFRSSGVPAFRCSGLPVFRYSSIPVLRLSGIPVLRTPASSNCSNSGTPSLPVSDRL